MTDNIDILVKLFDTLKEASDENRKMTQVLVTQQHDLVGHVKSLPIKELRDSLKDHSVQSSQEIDTCTEVVETKTGSISDLLKKIDNKISKMIIIVSVAFTLLAGIYVFVRAVSDVENAHFKHDILEMIEKYNSEKE